MLNVTNIPSCLSVIFNFLYSTFCQVFKNVVMCINLFFLKIFVYLAVLGSSLQLRETSTFLVALGILVP